MGRLGWVDSGDTALTSAWVRPGGFPAVVLHRDPTGDLWWLDVGDVAPAGRAALASALGALGPAEVRRWLDHQDETVRWRGVGAVGQLDARELAPRLQELALGDGMVPSAAQALLDRWKHDDVMRGQAILSMATLAGVARPVIASLASGAIDAVIPTPDDAAAVFVEAVAPRAAEAYARWWEVQRSKARPTGGPELQVDVVTGGLMRRDGPWMRPLAQGFRGVAGALRPEVSWVSWRWSSTGSSFDGLVFVNERWCWYPKPYRVLRPVLAAMWDG